MASEMGQKMTAKRESNIRSVNVDYLGEQQQQQQQNIPMPAAADMSQQEAPTPGNHVHAGRLKTTASHQAPPPNMIHSNDEHPFECHLNSSLERRHHHQSHLHHQSHQDHQIHQDQQQQHHGREELQVYAQPLGAGRDSVSAASARSKSTTLDSGFQTSWAGEHSPPSESISGSPSASSSGDAELSPIRATETMAIVERAPDSASSILSKLTTRVRGRSLTSANRPRERHQGQLAAEVAAAVPTTAAPCEVEQVVVEDNSRGRCAGKRNDSYQQQATDQRRRRGFSLNRSFSFHRQTQNGPAAASSSSRVEDPSGQVAMSNTTDKSAGEARTSAGQVRQRAHNELYANVERRQPGASLNSDRIEAAKLPATKCNNLSRETNLSSLFRSKSMRAVSQSSRWTGSAATAAGSKRIVNYDCDNRRRPHHNQHHLHHLHHHHHHHEHPNDNDGGDNDAMSAWKTNNQQATIDYLAGAQVHKRSFSIRRNSLLTFGKDELGGGAGKIAMFLRKLFSLRRTSRRPQEFDQHQGHHQDQDYSDERHRLVKVDIVHHLHHNRPEAAANCPKNGSKDGADQCAVTGCQCKEDNSNNNNCNNSTNNHRLFSTNSFVDIAHDDDQKTTGRSDAECAPGRRRQQRRRFEFAPSSPSYTSTASDNSGSSPSNSLIEILDCSPSLEESRRHLRQEEVERSFSANRATWRLVKRSESNLSQHSNISGSTNKSTVSQQLRRHLDEAYKRNRSKCTASKREREFIDSINVLRQASRHASLENSRSSSKNRHVSPKCSPSSTEQNTKNSTPMIESSTSTSDESTSCSVISGACGSHEHWPLAAAGSGGQLRLSGDDELTSWKLNEQQLAPTVEVEEKQQLEADHHEHLHQHQHHLRAPSNNNIPPLPAATCCCLYSTALSCLTQHQHQHQHSTAPTSNAPDLCQLACCLAPPPPPPSCCFGPLPPNPNQQLAFNSTNHQPATGNGLLLSEASDLCCPIWRSIIYSYCQQQAPPLPMPPPSGQLTDMLAQPQQTGFMPMHHQQFQPIELQQHQQQTKQQSEMSHTFTSSSLTNLQQQQQQHNTTIDLKIEIGADFKKKLAKSGASGGGTRSIRIKETRQQPQSATTATTSSDATSDSLDSSSHDDEPMATNGDSLVNSSLSSSSLHSAPSTRAKYCRNSTTTMIDGERLSEAANKLSGRDYVDKVHLRDQSGDDSSRALSAASQPPPPPPSQPIGNDYND